MLNIDQRFFWLDHDGCQHNELHVKNEIKNYISLGGKIYVGTDSMLTSSKCLFAVVIAFHDNEQKVAKYYYKRINGRALAYKELKVKILEEVNLSIQVAQYVLSVCPEALIELHVDIGTKKSNLTRKLYNVVKGWVTGLGFRLKVKPHSWASSSVADWHTK